MGKILVIDDEERILRLIKNTLELNGHKITLVSKASNLLIKEFQGFDLILLDVMMPDINGFDLCEKIREEVNCPIIFLTAKTDENSVVKGLVYGADDYITKPFGVKELNARVEAHIRREERKKQSKIISLGNIKFDFSKREVLINKSCVELTKNQYNICEFLVTNREMVFTKEQIYEEVYSIDSDTLISTITEHIRVIRKKFKEVDNNCDPIKTVWGVGYMWK